VACLALFITTIVFLSKYQGAQRNYTTLNQDMEDWVKSSERTNDAVQRFRDLAKKDRASVVGYLNESLRTSMTTISGAAGDTVDQLKDKLSKVEGASSNNLIGLVHARENDVADWKAKYEQADKDRKTALTDLGNEQARVKDLNAAHQKTVETMAADLDRYRAEVETYRKSVDDSKKFMDVNVEKLKEQFAQSESSYKEQNKTLSNENLQLKEQVAELRGKNKPNILRPAPEESLVDGTVISLNQSANQVTISRGVKDRIFLGMTFAVYSDATAIKPDPKTGDYPRPKAKLEVVNVGDTSSSCRITEETKGNPVVRGDVIANAIYDPSKQYTFLIFGNFDANGDGLATPAEAEDIRAMITAWGGKVTDELTGSVDFLVLGQKPQLPPKPTVDSPDAVVKEYIRLNGLVEKYKLLQDQAVSTSVPILNENRLYTLIGRKVGR
jgi:hypothetical protein